ncbi:MAG: hypothetical protein ACE5HB_00250, partial [Terriglobia bacterium]
LVQVPYRGVIYSRPAVLTAGDTISVAIEVFDAGARPEDIEVKSHVIFLEPHRGHVRLTEFYAVHNHSRPPRAYNPDGGSFRFTLPAGARELQGSAGRPGGMPLRQQPQPTDAQDSYALTYALKPGETEVRLNYVLPADNNTLELRLPLTVTTERRHLAIPRAGVELEAQGIQEVPQNEAPRMRVISIDPDARPEFRARLRFEPEALESAAALAPPPQATSQSVVEIIPHPVNRARWYILGLTLVVLSLGASYLYSLRPALEGNQAANAPSPAKPKRKR